MINKLYLRLREMEKETLGGRGVDLSSDRKRDLRF